MKNLFSTPKALPNQRRLFTSSVPNLSTQGNSAGQVNDPKVMSEGEYMCGVCDKTFPTKDQVTNHMIDVHDKAKAADDNAIADNSTVEENTENYNVSDEADDEDMAKLVNDYEDDILAEELARLANVVEAVNLQGPKCSECKNLGEVLKHKESVIKNLDKRTNTIQARQKKTDDMKEEITKDKKKLTQENAQLKRELKQSNDMLAEQLKKVSALTTELNTQKSLEEVNDSNQKIKCNHCERTFRNSEILDKHVEMEHISAAEHRCQACNHRFKSNDELELHMVEEHEEEADCMRCNAFFKTQNDYYKHASSCGGVIQVNLCDKCEREIVSKAALKKHRKGCHGKTGVEACRNGEQCRFHKENRCNFSHPQLPQSHPQQKKRQQQPLQQRINQRQQQRNNHQQQKKNNPQQQLFVQQQEDNQQVNQGWKTVEKRKRNSLQEQQREQRTNIQCRWGEGCKRLKSGLCPLKHSRLQNSIPHRSQSERPQLWCKFQETCLKGPDCRFKHFQQGFLQREPRLNHF